jgi:hypothetical protein
MATQDKPKGKPQPQQGRRHQPGRQAEQPPRGPGDQQDMNLDEDRQGVETTRRGSTSTEPRRRDDRADTGLDEHRLSGAGGASERTRVVDQDPDSVDQRREAQSGPGAPGIGVETKRGGPRSDAAPADDDNEDDEDQPAIGDEEPPEDEAYKVRE